MITFKSPAYASIPMLQNNAMRLLDMMGFGHAVPGAIDDAHVPEALQNLQQALQRLPPLAADESDDDDQPKISLHTRALPLLELLEAAIRDETYVRWE